MSEWTITGESGRSLGGTSVDLELTFYSDVSLTRTNQGVDTLSFFVASENPTTDPSYLPEFNQQISLSKNGARQFLGYVGKPKFILQGGIFGWRIEAQHGWNELDRVALTTGDAEYVRAQGSLSATITDIINKAIAGGSRLALGSVAAMFDIPAISFRGTSCGSAIAELLQIVPDAVAYFTYAAAGWPQLVIARRGSMTAQTFTFGTSEIVEPFSCSPIPGVTPTKITVAYATRDNNGIVTETIQSAGSGSDVQSVILTAGNVADFNTKAALTQQTMQTRSVVTFPAFPDGASAIAARLADVWGYSSARDAKLSAIAGIPAPNSLRELTYYIGSSASAKTSTNWVGVASSWTVDAGHFPLVQGAYQTWMSKLAITEAKTNLQVSFFWLWRRQVDGVEVTPKPDWLEALISAGARPANDNSQVFWTQFETSSTNTTNSDRAEVYRYDAIVEAPAISRSIPTATALRDPGDYGTFAPPSTLASNLLAAQSFVPYEGQLSLSPWEPETDLLARSVSFGGLTARLASIGAIVQSQTVDVQTGAKTIQLGLAARQGNTALARLRKLNS